jgi:hypothetical protein
MAYDQIESFMASIRRVESGSYDGDYAAIGAYTGPAGRALGAYQIMEGNWEAWSAEAGMEGATWRDPYAQDAVARYKMGQYYNMFGSWELAGVAWFAGPGTAAAAAREGYAAVAEINDTLGTTVGDYLRRLDEYMGDWDGKKRNGPSWWDEERTGQGPIAPPAPGSPLPMPENWWDTAITGMLDEMTAKVTATPPGMPEVQRQGGPEAVIAALIERLMDESRIGPVPLPEMGGLEPVNPALPTRPGAL